MLGHIVYLFAFCLNFLLRLIKYTLEVALGFCDIIIYQRECKTCISSKPLILDMGVALLLEFDELIDAILDIVRKISVLIVLIVEDMKDHIGFLWRCGVDYGLL